MSKDFTGESINALFAAVEKATRDSGARAVLRPGSLDGAHHGSGFSPTAPVFSTIIVGLEVAKEEIDALVALVLDSCSFDGLVETMRPNDRKEYERLRTIATKINTALNYARMLAGSEA